MVGGLGTFIRVAARSAALLVLHGAACEAAGGRGELQSTSSATIVIRLSVAPQYRLRTEAAPALGDLRSAHGTTAGYCIASNAGPLSLPVLLVGTGPGDAGSPAAKGAGGPGRAMALPIGTCGFVGASSAGLAPSDPTPHAGLLLIRPE